MVEVIGNSKKVAILLVIILLLAGTMIPIGQASTLEYEDGFDKGPSYKPVVPLKKVTFVNFDDETYIDDYAYLAAIPTAVFDDGEKLFSNPLLFYQDEYPVKEDKELILNTRVGIDCFMEDWMSYCNGYLDQMTLINVPKNKLDPSWKASEYTEIKSEDPYEIAAELTLSEWSYSDDAVIAVIDENPKKPEIFFQGEETGTIDANVKIKELGPFYTNQLDKGSPRPHYFEIPSESYKFLNSRTWWASIWVGTPPTSAIPVNINITLPAADPDSQFYCKNEDGEWMQAALTQGWNIGGMDKEKAQTYIYKDGKWYFTITDVPTFKLKDIVGKYGRWLDIVRNMLFGTTYQTDITLYPGVDIELTETPPFGCRDATFELISEREDVKLGFSIIGPSGEEIVSSVGEDLKAEESKTYEIHLDQLGECPKNKHYKISIYLLEDIDKPLDFKIKYSWHQNFSEAEGDALSSATEGAVLASILNAPLLYTDSSSLDDATKNALYTLGVENIYLVNLGNHIEKETKDKIKQIADIKEEYTELTEIYNKIMENTGENDIIFSTIDPWTWYYADKPKPYDETEAGLFIGPAAYCAAHHGSPVLIVDMHPELSSNVVWHTEFWKRYSNGFHDPPAACIYLTVTQIVKFLQNIGLDKEGVESMITIADQYEIGAPWDRAFVGVTNPGRICGSPVDTAYWISRNVFYPGIIFCNPAMNTNGVKLKQGSSSERRTILPWGTYGLKIVEPSEYETFNYPVLQLYLTYSHNLNDRFSKYYGFKYEAADSLIPGETSSYDTIDTGVVADKPGQQIWPDFSITEVTPYYLSEGGYNNVFSTNFDVMTENLNNGVLLFISSSHGTSANSGKMLSWNPEKSALSFTGRLKLFGYKKEDNPWRGYDWLLGSTENPDTMTMEVHGLLPALLGNPNIEGILSTGEDFWPSERPVLHTIGKILNSIPIIKWFVPEWLADSTYYKDGMIGAHTISGLSTTIEDWTGYNWDKALENVHSCGWLNGACLPAYKLFHLTMVRHGSVFQVIDPWSTSWYMYWMETIPKDLVLGYNIGEAYTRGISHVGILYGTDPPQWWWDTEQNLCLFGDPDLRIFVPGTDYSDANYWERKDIEPLRYDAEISIDGHMPYGATSHPNKKEPKPIMPLWLIILIIVILILIAIVTGTGRRKNK
jgi:hypothetical protein